MNTEIPEAREVLIYLSYKFKGDWEKIYEALRKKEYNFTKSEVDKALQKLKCKVITILDSNYPTYLRKVFRPPFVLYYYGDICLINDFTKAIAVVGSRDCSSYGISATHEIVKDIAKDFIIVSGMAKGIDSIAHQTAINYGGKTVAVMCTGIEKCYPADVIDLYKELKKNHLVISEYPGYTTPPKECIPFRNRLIAGMSRITIVGEAHMRSGTSITVGLALEMGRDVLCVPYPIDSHSLCNRLIQFGAGLVENGNDVYEEVRLQKFY